MTQSQSSRDETSTATHHARLATLSHHANELRELQDQADLDFPISMAGNLVTEKRSKMGVGVIQLVVVQKDPTYRIKEAMIVDPDENGDDVQWVEVKANTSLRHLLEKYGKDLLGYDARSRTTTVEAFAFEVFVTTTKSVRILLRKDSVSH